MNEEQTSRPSDMADEQNSGQDQDSVINADQPTEGSNGNGNGTTDTADTANDSEMTDAMAAGGQTEPVAEARDASDDVIGDAAGVPGSAGNGLVDQPQLAGDMPDDTTAQLDTSFAGGADAMPAPSMDAAMGEDEPVTMEPTGAEPTSEQPLDNQPSGDEPAGDPAEQPIGEPPTRDQPVGEPPTGDRPMGDAPMGDQDRGPARFQRQFQDEGSDEAPPELVVRPARDPNMENVASDASMEDLMKASAQQYRTLKHGDVLEGTVMKVDREEILLDIGAKTEGVIPSREATSMSEEERSALQVGDEVLVSVLQPENSEGHAVLSVDRARQERAWRDLHKQYEAGEIIQAQVVGHNKGGLLVNLEGIRGFVPSSQISSMPPGEANKQAELARLHSTTLPLKIIEINRNRNRLILSERQAMQEQRESMRSRLLQELEPGQIRPGTVTSICDFGAFVDIGGADGLIHLSELSWKRVSHPSELLKPGDRIDVYVLSVDPNERKIALSLKRTQPEPWDTITDQYQLGQVVHGTITQITSFGAFARLEDGIEGLIHVSELAEGRVAHPRNVVKEGDAMDLKVIRIDPARKRIGLSLKRMQEDAGTGEGAEVMGDEPRGEMGDSGEGEGGYTAPTPARERQFEQRAVQEREQRQPRQDRQERQDRQDRPQRAPVSSAKFNVPDEDDAPSGALAAALAAHAQRGRAAQEEEEAAPEQEAAETVEMQAGDVGTDIDTSSDTPTEPEAMMPAAADTDEAAADMTANTLDVTSPTDALDEGGPTDSGAVSGAEALPSVADTGVDTGVSDETSSDVGEDDTAPTATAAIGDAGESSLQAGDGSAEAYNTDDENSDAGSSEMPGDTDAGTDTGTDMDTSTDTGTDIDTGGALGDDTGSVEGEDTSMDTTGVENSDAGNYAENPTEAQTQSDEVGEPDGLSSVAGSEDLGEGDGEKKGKKEKKES